MTGHLVVLSTVASARDAERLARALVERALAACVSVVPGLVSTYRWEGEVRRDEERLLVIKTAAEAFTRLRAALVELHPYAVPEVLALRVGAGHAAYLAWIDKSLAASAPRRRARPRKAPGRGPRAGRRRPRSPR